MLQPVTLRSLVPLIVAFFINSFVENFNKEIVATRVMFPYDPVKFEFD